MLGLCCHTQLSLAYSLSLDDERAAPATVNKANMGSPNRICTTRFTVITWLPKSLFLKFQRVAVIVVSLGDDSPRDGAEGNVGGHPPATR